MEHSIGHKFTLENLNSAGHSEVTTLAKEETYPQTIYERKVEYA